MQVFETTAILEFDSKSAPSVAYSIHIVESMGSGYPFLRGAARNSNPETYPNSAQVLRIAAKLLIQGVPGTPSPRWWLQKAIVKSIKSAPSAAYSDQIVDWACAPQSRIGPKSCMYRSNRRSGGASPLPFPPFPRGVAGGRGLEIYPKSAPSAAYSDQIVDSGGAGQSRIGPKCCV